MKTWIAPLLLVAPASALQAISGDTLLIDWNAQLVPSSNPPIASVVGPAPAGLLVGTNASIPPALWLVDGSSSGSVVALQPTQVESVWGTSVTFPGGRMVFAGNYSGIERMLSIDPAAPQSGTTELAILSSIELPFGILNGSPPTLWNGEAWFFANDSTAGLELHRSNGTVSGTTLAEDLTPGAASSASVLEFNLNVAAGRLLFTSTTPQPGLYAKATPSSQAVRVLDLAAHSQGTDPFTGQPLGLVEEFREIGAGLQSMVFAADAGTGKRDLFRSDGTLGGTFVLQAGNGTDDWQPLVSQAGVVYYAYSSAPGNATPYELWRTDGTVAGTVQIAPLVPAGTQFWVPSAPANALIGSRLVVAGFDYTATGALGGKWSIDVASGATQLLSPGGVGQAPFVDGGFAYYSASTDSGSGAGLGLELFRSNGTQLGTTVLADLYPGSSSSHPVVLGAVGQNLIVNAIDGTGTGHVAYGVNTVTGSSAPLGLSGATAITAGSRPEAALAHRGELYWLADAGLGLHSQLLRSDGSSFGTSVLLPPANLGTGPYPVGSNQGKLLLATFGAGGVTLSSFDGISYSQIASGLPPAPSFHPDNPEYAQRAYFTGISNNLWVTDQSAAGTRAVGITGSGNLPVASLPYAPLADSVIFTEGDAQSPNKGEPVINTGTGAPSQLLADLWPGPIPSEPYGFVTTAEHVFFFAEAAGTSTQVFATDGTSAGTLQASAFPFVGGTILQRGSTGITAFAGGALFSPPVQTNFFVPGTVYPSGLWFAQAQASSAVQLHPLDAQAPYVREFRVSGSLAYFLTRDAQSSTARELWVTDGTSAGTFRISPVGGSLAAGWMEPFGSDGHLLFFFDDGVHGYEPWISDGSLAGTQLLIDLRPGAAGSIDPGSLFEAWLAGGRDVNDWVAFAADDGISGLEMHRFDLADVDAMLAATIGQGCGAVALDLVGLPQIGTSPALRVSKAKPFSPAATWLALETVYQPLGGGCEAYLGQPFAKFLTIPTNAAGVGSVALAIPAIASLQGLGVTLQGAAVDPFGPLLGLVSLTNGLQIIVGS